MNNGNNTHGTSSNKRPTSFVSTDTRPPFKRSLSYKKSVHRSSARPISRPKTSRGNNTAIKGLNARDRQKALRKDMPRIERKRPDDVLPPVGDNIRIIPLGGVEEVGKNMIVVEYKDDIIIFDVGFQFTTEEDAPGIDYILPNTKYLEDRKDKIRGVVITHGHLDHIGGIPYIMDRIGNPKIYTRSLTSMMIQKRQSEFPHLPKLDIRIVEPGDNIMLGKLKLKFHAITHSIPDAMATSLETPYGNIIVTGDLKLDHVDGEPTDKEKKVWGEIGKENNLLFISDSTNVSNPGFSITESKIHKNLEEIIKNVPGRLFIGTFASQFERIMKIVEIAEKYGKKVRELMVKEMGQVFSQNKGFVLSSIENIKASDMDGFRKKMRQSGTKYMVIKNRLAKIALEEAGITIPFPQRDVHLINNEK